jgi:RHS repeat-associated protein
LEAWVKPTSGAFSTVKPVLVKGYTSHAAPYYQYAVIMLDTGAYPKLIQLSLTIGGTLQQLNVTNSGWQYGVWQHIVATYDGSTMRIYRNGNQVGSRSQTGSLSTYSTPLAMGCFENLTKSSSYCLQGVIDEPAVYGAALSSTQVNDHYQAGSATIPVNTVAPSITGIAQEARTLVAGNGTWLNDPDVFAYRWRRCNSSGGACEDVPGAIGHLYIPGRDDVGRTIRVRVTATNSGGSESADSAASNPIGGLPLPTPPSYQEKVLDTNPDHYWGLGETSGTTGAALDTAGSSDGDYEDSPSTPTLDRGVGGPAVPGRVDEALHIGGSTGSPSVTGHVEVPANSWGMGGQQNFSVSFWLRWEGQRFLTGSPVNQGLIGNLNFTGQNGGWGVYLTPTGKVAFRRNTSGSTALETLISVDVGFWHLVTVTYDGSWRNIYLDGQPVAAVTDTSSLAGGAADLKIGRQDFNLWLSGYDGSLNGTIDEVALWRRALSPSEVEDMYIPPLDLPYAQTYGAETGCLDFACNVSHSRAEPVNTATGSYWTQTTDVELPGIGIPFRFARTYNSNDPAVGTLGEGWTHNLAASLSVLGNGDVRARAADGQVLEFTLQPDGSYESAPGGRSTLELVSGDYELTLHDQELLTFNAQGRFLSQVDENGNGLTFAYDGNGRLSTVTDAAERVVTFTHDSSSGLLTEIELPDERTVSYAYTDGRLTSATDLRGGVTEHTYTAEGWLETIVDQNDHTVVENTYDSDGRVIAQLDALGEETTFSWDPETQTSVTTDARGEEWTDVYVNNVLVETTDPLGNTTSYRYDADFNRISETDARGNETTMSFDAAGNMLTRTAPAPLSYEEAFAYDGDNNLLSHENGRGYTTAYEYDGDGNLIEKTEPGSRVTEYAYDPDTGLLLSVTDAEEKTTTYGYDADGNLVSIERPSGALTTMDYDVSGHMITRVDPRGNEQGATPEDYETTFTYDDADHLLTQTDPLGNVSEWEYDPVGNLEKVIDAEGRETEYVYDAANRLDQVIAPDETVTDYDYDETGNLISRLDAEEHETMYAYDDAGRLEQVVAPLGREWTYAFDENGNRMEMVDANGNATGGDPDDGTTSYEYDELNRLVGIDYSDATPDVTFDYDENGNRVEMADGAGTVTYEYDELDRLETVTRGSDVFAYEYDDVGNVTERTLPGSRVVTHTYTDDHELDTVSEDGQTTDYDYDPAGNLETTTLPSGNGYVETRAYDEAGRLIAIESAKSGTPIFEAAYALDGVGNPEQITTLSGTETYAYDLLDRLIEVCYQASCPNGNDPFIRYDYDDVGNRSEEERPAGTTAYTYDVADRLTERDGPGGTIAYDYDHNGNQTAAGARTFTYDLADRLASTTLSGSTIDYAYDGDGVRLEADAGPNPADITEYLWDTNSPLPELVRERDGSATALRDYLHGNDLVSMTVGGDPFYYHYDRIGSVTNVTSETGDAQWTYDYEPFGAARTTTQNDPNAPENLMRFTGELADPATDLYHLRARQYDPGNGRFLATDPLPPRATSPFISTYVYANDRPTALIDPSGMGAASVNSHSCGSLWCWLTSPRDWIHDRTDVLGAIAVVGGGSIMVGSVFATAGCAAATLPTGLGPVECLIMGSKTFSLGLAVTVTGSVVIAKE